MTQIGVIESLLNGTLDFPMLHVLATVRNLGGQLIYADTRKMRNDETLWTLVFHDIAARGTDYEYFRLQQMPGPFGPTFQFLKETPQTVIDNYSTITEIRRGEYGGWTCHTQSGFNKYASLRRDDVETYITKHNAAITRASSL